MDHTKYDIRVAPNCGIMFDGHIVPAGRTIPGEAITKEQFEEWTRSGYGIPVNSGAAPAPDIPTDDIPQNRDTPPIPSDPLAAQKPQQPKPPVENIQTTKPTENTIAPPVPVQPETEEEEDDEPVVTDRSLWVHNPANLEGKPLEELNVMVAEIDPDIPPFNTIEEAMAQLSLDFEETEDAE